MVVDANGALTAAQTIQLSPATPGLAAFPDGSVIAQHWVDSSDYGRLSGQARRVHRAVPGGDGATDNPVASGAASPLDPLSRVTIASGGNPGRQLCAGVLFAGLTPGWVGLYQINLGATCPWTAN